MLPYSSDTNYTQYTNQVPSLPSPSPSYATQNNYSYPLHTSISIPEHESPVFPHQTFPNAPMQPNLYSANISKPIPTQFQPLQHLPIQSTPQKKSRQNKPLHRLSVSLLKTYNTINANYYEKQKIKQQQQAQVTPSYPTTYDYHSYPVSNTTHYPTSYPTQHQNSSSHAPPVPHFPSLTAPPMNLPPTSYMNQTSQPPAYSYQPPPVLLPPTPKAPLLPPQGSHNDGYDDSEGNYTVQIGEELEGRYMVQEVLGRGSFGVVCKCVDKQTQELVAVKIIKNRYQFYQQAKVEIDILKTLNEKDSDNAYNIVQLKNYFTWRKHLCLVFELLSYNLYDLLKYTKFKGVSLNLIRKFAQQLLITLSFLSRPDIRVIHCDLKPENILLKNHKKSAIKVIDFGSSCFVHRKMHKYIQSRFYRSPEVILGNSYACPIDMWSLGCILIEMHIGVPVFDGKDELDQLRKIAAVLGMPPAKIIQQSTKKAKFFVYDSNTQTFKFKLPTNPTHIPSRSFADILGTNRGGPHGKRINEVNHTPHDYAIFLDLVQRMLQYDPAQRILPHQALNHDFFVKYNQATVPPLPESPVVLQAQQNVNRAPVPQQAHNPTLLASHLSTTTVSLAQVYQQHHPSLLLQQNVMPSPLMQPSIHPSAVVANSTSSTNVYIHPNHFVVPQSTVPQWPGYPYSNKPSL